MTVHKIRVKYEVRGGTDVTFDEERMLCSRVHFHQDEKGAMLSLVVLENSERTALLQDQAKKVPYVFIKRHHGT